MAEQAPTPQETIDTPKERMAPGTPFMRDNKTFIVVDSDKEGKPNRFAEVTDLMPDQIRMAINETKTQVEGMKYKLHEALSSPKKLIENTVQRVMRKEDPAIKQQRDLINAAEKQYGALKRYAVKYKGLRVNEWNPHNARLSRGNEFFWNGVSYAVLSEKKNGIYRLEPSFQYTIPKIEKTIDELDAKLKAAQKDLGGPIKKIQAVWDNLTAEKPNAKIALVNAIRDEIGMWKKMWTRRKHGYTEA